jgi:aconitate hydratase
MRPFTTGQCSTCCRDAWWSAAEITASSSREHAAIAPRYLTQGCDREKLCPHSPAKSDQFWDPAADLRESESLERIDQDDVLSLPDIRAAIQQEIQVKVINKTKGETYSAEHALTGRQVEIILSGSLLNLMRKRQG